ncbi:uncharacterized protein C2orf73 homolog [Protopterus annectens]|uniref:uncharacterized protein C2orf73 homolog n=1 Tax=Protopterus annectens TaxID=7888 RepID=UPI001CFB43BD|nr:uncharacterized protein C2orf73 homolog [Protopterus annectens]
MYQTLEIYMSRKKRVQGQFYPNTYRIFDERIPNESMGEEKYNLSYVHRKPDPLPQHPRSPTRHNIPHPYYARFINTNPHTLNEPVIHMETKVTIDQQHHWWPSGTSHTEQHKPKYSKQSTQRMDYQNLENWPLPKRRYNMNPNRSPASGIVPLADSRTPHSAPKILLEKVSYHHQYNSRASPNEPIRGKRHGAFVWSEINPKSGTMAPKGAEAFLSTAGSYSLKQPTAERGNSVKGKMTSPKLLLQNSQQMLHSEPHLSKTDFKETAKAYPRNSAGGQHNSSICPEIEMPQITSSGVGSHADTPPVLLDKHSATYLTNNIPLPTTMHLQPVTTTKAIDISLECNNYTMQKMTPVDS